jgi:transcriptional regulator with XRE-family HTH domain
MQHPPWKCFHVGIKAFRDHGWMKMSQKDLAQRIGYTTTHISQVFQGKRKASPDLQEKLAQEFGLQIENVIKAGRDILDGRGFMPFIGQIDDLPAHSEAQARRIVTLTNRAFGIEGHLLLYRPELWDSFVSGKVSAIEFYSGYAEELQRLIAAIKASPPATAETDN